MADRFKFECVCGQHLVARKRMAGTRIHCPACKRELTVPVAGQELVEDAYAATERYALTCSCGYRMLVKAETAGRMVHCPMCRSRIIVPDISVLRKETTLGLEANPERRERVHTEDLLLLIDDDEGPGTEIS